MTIDTDNKKFDGVVPDASMLVGELADQLGKSACANLVFADAVVCEGVTVIPVASVRYGFGGGVDKHLPNGSAGLGGGLHASPVGYIEVRDGSARFCPIADIMALARMAGLGLLIGLLTASRLPRSRR